MVFSSNIFLFIFLPLTLLLYFALPKTLATKSIRNAILLITSLTFYAWGEAHYIFLLLISIAANYLFGLAIADAEPPENGPCKKCSLSLLSKLLNKLSPRLYDRAQELSKHKKLLITTLALIFNLVLLAYFKYANFLIENLNQIFSWQIENKKIHLPIGISFFTFHAISYLIDIYRGKCKPQKNIFDLALYISFFPQLVAGPIVRYNFVEKYLTKRRNNPQTIAYGIRRFIIGLGKKIIIANPLGEVADVIFSSPLSEINAGVAWFGLICYTLQIYFDFSGYSDMAIGLARIFGFKFPENFNYPYISRSIKDFWRRWHISLSSWFRDYVYIPLGGNRVSLSRQYFNLVLVFFLCGLWHGASWNFIIWGMFHGSFLVFERIFQHNPFTKNLKIIPHIYTIFIVMIAWVFFRSPDLNHSLGFLHTMFFNNEITSIPNEIGRLMHSNTVLTSLILALIGLSPLIKNISINLIRKNKAFLLALDFTLILILTIALIRLSASTYNPFIYFQF